MIILILSVFCLGQPEFVPMEKYSTAVACCGAQLIALIFAGFVCKALTVFFLGAVYMAFCPTHNHMSKAVFLAQNRN